MKQTLVLFLLVAAAGAAENPIPWKAGVYEAYAAARDAKKPLVLLVYREGAQEFAQFETELAAAQIPAGAVIFGRQDAGRDDANGNVARIVNSLGLQKTPVVVVLRCAPDKIEEIGRVEEANGLGAKVARLVAGERSPLAKAIADAGYLPVSDEMNPCENYWFNVDRDGWNYRYVVGPADEGFVWVAVILGAPDRVAALPADVLLKLLAENDRLGRRMRIQVSAQSLCLCYMLPKEEANAQGLSTAIDAIAENAKRMEPLWNPAKWSHAS